MENRISLMEGLVDAFLGRTGRWKRGRVVPVISFWLAGFSLLYHNSKTVVRRLSL